MNYKITCILVILTSQTLWAAYVTPKMGGGQQNAPMVMPNVLFDGQSLSVTGIVDMMGNPLNVVPVLRPLTPPDEFDPAKAWAVLSGKAYNLQYGWNLDAGSEFLPSGANIWIEQTGATPGLLTYERGTYAPIFATAGSSNKWMWDGVMAHNAYATPATIGNWSATYQLYLGDSFGTALPGYDGTSVTLNWTSVPEPASLAIYGAVVLLARRRKAGNDVRHAT